MQHEVLSILAEAHDYESYVHKLEAARFVLAGYEERLASGDVEIKDLVVSKRITKEPRDYQKAGVSAIAAQQLFGSGVKLRPGQNIEYIITDSESAVPNDRVRAFALWEGWFGYDRKKYAALTRGSRIVARASAQCLEFAFLARTTSAIVTTTFTDNDGHPVLTQHFPVFGQTSPMEFTLQTFDLAGNLTGVRECSSSNGVVTVWATNLWTFDGLNRPAS